MQATQIWADHNLKYFVFIRIFAKRVFLPLTAIYFMDHGNLSIRDIGLLSAYFSFIQLLVEVPTGYFADRIGRVASLRIGSVLAGLATLFYVLIQNKTGIYLGVALEALGYSFLGGAGEALVHDSLQYKNQLSKYTTIMSHNMALSLIVNAIFVSLTGLTYSLDPRLPFILGTTAYALLFLSTFALHDLYPPKPKITSFALPRFSFIFNHKSLLVFALTFGIISALYTSPNDMLNYALREYGLAPQYLGFIYAFGSIGGALLGPLNPVFRRLRPNLYVLLDSLILFSLYLSAASGTATILAVTMVMGISFWRYRRIIYQDYLLRIYPNAYKATLVSTLNNLEQGNAIWLPLLITALISHQGLIRGFSLMTIFTVLTIPLFYFSAHRFLTRRLPTT